MVTGKVVKNLYFKESENEMKTRISLLCEELLEKEVKANFGYGYIRLPRDWVGKQVKVARVS
ncbi:MAG: DUF2080 family transposase-associated protein [Deltaproteobacteria bacterium]|jgi:hypothetical protein|nr:DUF2080 family transposase-associated protein [Deltaproteobacteria bacterium]